MKYISLNRLLALASLTLTASAALQGQEVADLHKLLDRVVEREQSFVEHLRTRAPLVETYIQESRQSAGSNRDQDHYFLGRLNSAEPKKYTPIVPRPDSVKRSLRFVSKNRSVVFEPTGFAQMIYIDPENFNRDNYSFDYVRREFSGGVRCIVFDVAPLDKKVGGRFIGRIWVEEREVQIVRFNGTYTGSSASKHYFHFDSWRLAATDGEWVPALVYVEEAAKENKHNTGLTFKAQMRLWGYNSGNAARMDESTNLSIELEVPPSGQDNLNDTSPLENQRSWEHQAERNILDRLEKGGFLAAKGPVDSTLETVVNNLLATNGMSLDVHCRVMLTTPLETFSVGRTIVISRGLLDVLPDEASLAVVISDELAHIVLGHGTNTQFAFHNQTMFSDEDMLQRFRFSRKQDEIEAAGEKAAEILAKSPYQAKLSNAGLFLKALSSRASRFPNLIRANIGNGLANEGTIQRIAGLTPQVPLLEERSLEQIAALPLGSRIKLDPWTSTISIMKAKPVALLSPREKLLFEITPFAPQLSHAGTSPTKVDLND